MQRYVQSVRRVLQKWCCCCIDEESNGWPAAELTDGLGLVSPHSEQPTQQAGNVHMYTMQDQYLIRSFCTPRTAKYLNPQTWSQQCVAKESSDWHKFPLSGLARHNSSQTLSPYSLICFLCNLFLQTGSRETHQLAFINTLDK